MFGGHRSVGAALALVTGVAGAVVVAAGSAATPAGAAAPVPCVRTVSGGASAVAAAPAGAGELSTTAVEVAAPQVPSAVEDVDVTFAIVHDNAAQLRVRLSHAGSSGIVQRRLAGSGPQVRPLTWDDEAGVAYGPDSPAGTYVPDEPLTVHDGSRAGGTWRLLIDNWANAEGRLVSWSIRISYSTCDADDDGAEDHTDNCTGVANPDQADADADGLGDACDGDLDGDGLVGATDNCAAVPNADQTDSDADGAGDPCDGDDDGDGRADGVDGCRLAPGATTTGCPAVTTRIALRKKDGRLVGRVASDVRACVSGVDVTLKRKRPGRDTKLVVLTARPDGRFRTRAPRAAGRYYVLVRKRYAAGVAECGSSRSAPIRVRR